MLGQILFSTSQLFLALAQIECLILASLSKIAQCPKFHKDLYTCKTLLLIVHVMAEIKLCDLKCSDLNPKALDLFITAVSYLGLYEEGFNPGSFKPRHLSPSQSSL